MIAMARACKPELLIADEPTTALDVTIQAQILDLMRGLRTETGTAILLITHDLGVVAQSRDDVAVMYAGQIVEYRDVDTIYDNPLMGHTPKDYWPRSRCWARCVKSWRSSPGRYPT